MVTYTFIYSNNYGYRFLRHFLFWIAWISYFIIIDSTRSGAKVIGQGPFLLYTIIETIIFLSVDIVFCYAVLYLLLPKYLLQGKYVMFFILLGLFMLLDAALSQYFYLWLINPLRRAFHLMEFESISFTDLLRGMSGVLMITGIACSIRFLKMWNIKKQELDLVKSEKLRKEIQFIDTYIQPSFLPLLLKKIYSYSFSSSNKVPEMLEKLQRILAYLINECNQSSVLLSHEIASISDLIQLERLTNSDRLVITFEQSGDPENFHISPFILFPLVENNFRQVNDNITDKHWTTIILKMVGTSIQLQLKNSKPVETSNLMNYETRTIQQLKKRLELLYPGSHILNIIIEENVFNISIEIDLSKAVN